jgi:hypothetical protein
MEKWIVNIKRNITYIKLNKNMFSFFFKKRIRIYYIYTIINILNIMNHLKIKRQTAIWFRIIYVYFLIIILIEYLRNQLKL